MTFVSHAKIKIGQYIIKSLWNQANVLLLDSPGFSNSTNSPKNYF